MSIYNFTRLIRKYSTDVTFIIGVTEGVWNDDGECVGGERITENRTCAVIPFDVKTIAQLGGVVTQSDRQVYSLTPFKHDDKFEHQGMKYKIDTSIDFTAFGDFYRYVAKGVSSFD
ncbi:hypothetical protein ACIQXG_19325 [Lysinibacillus sphaericus]|uniref:hypothetical protein n=1 Tax=Lysinibacillus sphaericus TaxID=1421 RepID=UPI0038277A82